MEGAGTLLADRSRSAAEKMTEPEVGAMLSLRGAGMHTRIRDLDLGLVLEVATGMLDGRLETPMEGA